MLIVESVNVAADAALLLLNDAAVNVESLTESVPLFVIALVMLTVEFVKPAVETVVLLLNEAAENVETLPEPPTVTVLLFVTALA